MKPLLEMREDENLAWIVLLEGEFRHLRDALREYRENQSAYQRRTGILVRRTP
jgi:hypothetical protein